MDENTFDPYPHPAHISPNCWWKTGTSQRSLPALATIAGSCVNRVEPWEIKTSKVPLSSRDRAKQVGSTSLFHIFIASLVPQITLYCQACHWWFNCPSLFPLGSALSLRCGDQNCLCNITSQDVLWFSVKGSLFCLSFNLRLDSAQHFVDLFFKTIAGHKVVLFRGLSTWFLRALSWVLIERPSFYQPASILWNIWPSLSGSPYMCPYWIICQS